MRLKILMRFYDCNKIKNNILFNTKHTHIHQYDTDIVPMSNYSPFLRISQIHCIYTLVKTLITIAC